MRMRRATDPEYGRDWIRKHPDRARAARKRWRLAHLERDRASLRRAKGAENPSGELKSGPCEICGRICEKLHYDHDHKNGQFRGWLCGPCNRALGCFGDDIGVLRKAVSYLEANCVADYAERLLEQRQAS